jgi:hypothetical protein
MSARSTLPTLLLAALALGCARGPAKTYESMVAAAREGNVERFADGFTDESRGLVTGLIDLTTAYGVDKKNPLTLLGDGKALRDEPVTCPANSAFKECAVVSVQQGSRERKVLFVKAGEGWKIDLRALEVFWKDKANQ